MSTIPTKITQEAFDCHIRPHLSTAQRGYECRIPLYKVFNYILYWLHTGCQWKQLPVERDAQHPENPEKREISYHAVYYHFRKWSHDGSWRRVWEQSILTVQEELDLSELNLDGTHTLAKKGGESVSYQGRKKAKTCNILPLMEAQGYIVATTGIVAGNHHDAYHLKPHLQAAFKSLKRLGLSLYGAFFQADSAFDTKEARKTCFNHGLRPNMVENKRNRKRVKRGRPRLFDAQRYKRRFVVERSFAWVDKFKRLLIRFERKDLYFLAAHHIAFAMINLRHRLA
jgi:transposase